MKNGLSLKRRQWGIRILVFRCPVVYENLPNDIDVVAVQDGYLSITPLHYDLTSYKLIEEVKSWGIKVLKLIKEDAVLVGIDFRIS